MCVFLDHFIVIGEKVLEVRMYISSFVFHVFDVSFKKRIVQKFFCGFLEKGTKKPRFFFENYIQYTKENQEKDLLLFQFVLKAWTGCDPSLFIAVESYE